MVNSLFDQAVSVKTRGRKILQYKNKRNKGEQRQHIKEQAVLSLKHFWGIFSLKNFGTYLFALCVSNK